MKTKKIDMSPIKPAPVEEPLKKYVKNLSKKDTTKTVTTLNLSKASLFILDAHDLNRSQVIDDILKDFILKNNLTLKRGA